MKRRLFILFLLSLIQFSNGQDRSALDSLDRKIRIKKDPLTPSRAAFYSAVIPGLGQIHTRRYWTLPLIYGGLAASVYVYIEQRDAMNVYREAYKQRIRGDFSDQYSNRIPLNSQLIQGMEFHKRNRDFSMMWFFGIYLLNILDANVGAHLLQFNVDDRLSIKPYIEQNTIFAEPQAGLAFHINF